MTKSKTKARTSHKDLIQWLNTKPIWAVITVLGALLGVITSSIIVSQLIINSYKQHIGWEHVEQHKISLLAPMETNEYIESVMGKPILRDKVGSYTKNIYKGRNYWVISLTDSSNTAQAIGITSCGDSGFYPAITNNPFGHTINLGKDKMSKGASGVYVKRSDVDEGHYYFVGGASRPQYFYDFSYVGVGYYRDVITGNNSYCNKTSVYQLTQKDSRINKIISNLSYLRSDEVSEVWSASDINYLRDNLTLNTIVLESSNSDKELSTILMKSDLASLTIDYRVVRGLDR